MSDAVLRAICALQRKLSDAPNARVRASVTFAQDLAALSRSVRARPIQLSSGTLRGVGAYIRIGGIDLYYMICNQRLLFRDNYEVVGALLHAGTDDDDFVRVGHRALGVRPSMQPGMYLKVDHQADLGGSNDLCDLSGTFPDRAVVWKTAAEIVEDIALHNSSGEEVDIYLSSQKLAIIFGAFAMHCLVYQKKNDEIKYRNIVRFINAVNDSRNFCVEELTEELKMSRRTLHNSSSKSLGIGPKRLAKNIGLRNVIGAIPLAAKTGRSIGDLAFDHGFESFPHFSADYRSLFGERPSDTFRRYACA